MINQFAFMIILLTFICLYHFIKCKLFYYYLFVYIYIFIFIIRLNPLYDQAMNNLANILKDQGKLLEAEKLLMSAIEIRYVSLTYS